jgi:acetyltransferase (GNAT) family protein
LISVQRETFDQAVEDVKRLLPEHWREMAQRQDEIPLAPDWPKYEALFAADLARIYTVRDDDELVGYIILIVVPRHLHYDHRWAKDDTVWLKPSHRSIGAATALFTLVEHDMEADAANGGATVLQIETREGHPELEFLLESRGYTPTGRVFGKRFA